MKPEIYNMMEIFGRVFNKYKELQKTSRDYGTGEKLSSSEIHAITYVFLHPDKNITELAELIGVTKGAVSQMVNKLRKKGYVEKYRYYDNDKEVLIRLTEKGTKAHQGHIDFEMEFYRSFYDYMNNLSDEEISIITTFLIKVDKAADDYLELK